MPRVDVVRRVRLVVIDVEPAGLEQLLAWRAKETSMTGSRRPWAMKARVLWRSASDGCHRSTVGTKPEKARIPAGAGRSGPSPSA